jgi:hypothetical protein
MDIYKGENQQHDLLNFIIVEIPTLKRLQKTSLPACVCLPELLARSRLLRDNATSYRGARW